MSRIIPEGSQENTPAWREGYSNSRRSFFTDNNKTALTRLTKMGITELQPLKIILDFGCGDGNLIRYLSRLGFSNVIGIEPDLQLLQKKGMYLQRLGFWNLACNESSQHTLDQVLFKKYGQNMTKERLPFKDQSFDAVVSMAVLHHLHSEAEIRLMAEEFHRILKPGGSLFYAEPSNTWIRNILTKLLLSPLGGVTEFSRKKRLMVLEEFDTLSHWLKLERKIPENVLMPTGFFIANAKREPLKTFVHAKKIDSMED